MPIDCFYHVYAERMDIPRIEIEPEVDTGLLPIIPR